ncbi:hypothetical protein NMY22_g17159 [Coprinellus aureogranulatus]|nr:hypothetical protein NMY22_g17159 [Coprinellus aureogranulatus]
MSRVTAFNPTPERPFTSKEKGKAPVRPIQLTAVNASSLRHAQASSVHLDMKALDAAVAGPSSISTATDVRRDVALRRPTKAATEVIEPPEHEGLQEEVPMQDRNGTPREDPHYLAVALRNPDLPLAQIGNLPPTMDTSFDGAVKQFMDPPTHVSQLPYAQETKTLYLMNNTGTIHIGNNASTNTPGGPPQINGQVNQEVLDRDKVSPASWKELIPNKRNFISFFQWIGSCLSLVVRGSWFLLVPFVIIMAAVFFIIYAWIPGMQQATATLTGQLSEWGGAFLEESQPPCAVSGGLAVLAASNDSTAQATYRVTPAQISSVISTQAGTFTRVINGSSPGSPPMTIRSLALNMESVKNAINTLAREVRTSTIKVKEDLDTSLLNFAREVEATRCTLQDFDKSIDKALRIIKRANLSTKKCIDQRRVRDDSLYAKFSEWLWRGRSNELEAAKRIEEKFHYMIETSNKQFGLLHKEAVDIEDQIKKLDQWLKVILNLAAPERKATEGSISNEKTKESGLEWLWAKVAGERNNIDLLMYRENLQILSNIGHYGNETQERISAASVYLRDARLEVKGLRQMTSAEEIENISHTLEEQWEDVPWQILEGLQGRRRRSAGFEAEEEE